MKKKIKTFWRKLIKLLYLS